MIKKNDIIESEIYSLTNECYGVGKADGMVIFVPFSAIGDKLRIRILKVNKTYAYGKIEEIITPSPDRITPDCAVFGKCGGCSLRHISYEAELRAKEQSVKDAFTRIGSLSPEFLPIIPNGNVDGYRNKLQMPIGKGKGGDITSGFYAFHSHRIVPCESCLLQPGIFSDIVRRFTELSRQENIPPYDEERGKGVLRHIYLRRGHYSHEICLCIIATRKMREFYGIAEKLALEFPDIKSAVLNINPDKTNVILSDKEILLFGDNGRAEITDTMCGNTVSIAPKAFYQVNTPAAERLYAEARKFAEPDGKTVLDLYCGAGTIGLSMARQAKKIIGVEIIPEAVENARANAAANKVENAEFICADAAKAAKILLDRGLKPDVVIVDPPRKGCGEQACEYIARFGAQRIVMVSCNPATAARDCKYLEELGYRTEKVRAADMFSRTGHVECVVLLINRNSNQTRP